MLENNDVQKTERNLPVMRVIMEAWKLEEYTLNITSNARHYPKKYRFSLCQEIQKTALEIGRYLLEANEADLKDTIGQKDRRIAQSIVMRKCKVLLHYIELSKRMRFISDSSFEYWARIAHNVKNMCAKWQMSDLNRIKHFAGHKGDAL